MWNIKLELDYVSYRIIDSLLKDKCAGGKYLYDFLDILSNILYNTTI